MEQKDLTVGKVGYLVRMTGADLVEAVPFQVLAPEDAQANRAAALERDRQYVGEVTARLALAHPALHPIIEHHSPENSGLGLWCQGCDEGAHADDSPAWPCSTIDLIRAGLE